jgi:hypothetical protein
VRSSEPHRHSGVAPAEPPRPNGSTKWQCHVPHVSQLVPVPPRTRMGCGSHPAGVGVMASFIRSGIARKLDSDSCTSSLPPSQRLTEPGAFPHSVGCAQPPTPNMASATGRAHNCPSVPAASEDDFSPADAEFAAQVRLCSARRTPMPASCKSRRSWRLGAAGVTKVGRTSGRSPKPLVRVHGPTERRSRHAHPAL